MKVKSRVQAGHADQSRAPYSGDPLLWCRVAVALTATVAIFAVTSTDGSTAVAGTSKGPDPVILGTGRGPATDERYVAFTKADGVPVVFDTKTSRAAEIEDADDCVPAAIGAGQVLLQCSSPDRGSGTPYRRARTASVKGGPSVAFFKLSPTLDLWAIGRYWVGGSQSCSGGCSPRSPLFINRRTGKTRLISYDNHPYRDVDSKRLKRLPDSQPFTVKIRGRIVTQCSNDEVVVTSAFGLLRLWTDRQTSTVIGESVYASFSCDPYPVQFSDEKVVWNRGITLNTVYIDSGKKVQQSLGRSLNRPIDGEQPPFVMDRGTVFTDQGLYFDDNEIAYRIRYFPWD